MREFWKSWGNLLVLLLNSLFLVVALLMRAELREYVRAELKNYVTTGRFDDYRADHERWGSDRMADILRQLQKAEADRVRMEAKLDRLAERVGVK